MQTPSMTLCKTVDCARGTYRIFEFSLGFYYVLDADGRTVDQFEIVELAGMASGVSVKQAVRTKRPRPGVPNLARGLVSELNAARLRH